MGGGGGGGGRCLSQGRLSPPSPLRARWGTNVALGAPGAAADEACAVAHQPHSLNGTVWSDAGSASDPLAMAWLMQEGPRGEGRRAARQALVDEQQRALRRGYRLFLFERCSLPSGASGVLAGRSAEAACHLGRLAAAHRCPSAAGPSASAAPSRCVPAQSGMPPGHESDPPPHACDVAAKEGLAAGRSRSPAVGSRELNRSQPSLQSRLEGCRLSCTRGARRAPGRPYARGTPLRLGTGISKQSK